MWTVLLRLEAPLQSWGLESRFTERDTALEPTKSGVVGLAGCALGMSRDDQDWLAKLAALSMAVRVDRQGTILRDFHTAGAGERLHTASGKSKKGPVVSNRYYLSDASFLVALGGEKELTGAIYEALGRPRWPLFLGRKACAPSAPVQVPGGHLEGRVDEVLRAHALPEEVDPEPRLVLECGPDDGVPRRDVPLSFSKDQRRYSLRYVRSELLSAGGA